jgi:2-polyprenyl-3-methyl-5-hydroxy-6-metoxy-1,4-benzoquinol methylase
MSPTSAAGQTAGSVQRVISGEANPAYAAFHRPRFTFLIEVLRDRGATATWRVLDIGASPLTSLLASELGVRVESMGLEREARGEAAVHHRFDLNALEDRGQWRTDLGPYDVIVFAEVLEHLYTAPELVLPYLRELLVPGGVLLLQTPNAVSLRKRAKMVLGVNPFERIRAARDNPGHFREYTASELKEFLVGAGFSVDRVWLKHYFDVRYARHERGDEPPQLVFGALKNAFYRLLPASLREGITILARKP